jgi:hypothetical protein
MWTWAYCNLPGYLLRVEELRDQQHGQAAQDVMALLVLGSVGIVPVYSVAGCLRC